MKRAILIGPVAVLAVALTVPVVAAAATTSEANNGTYAHVETSTREVTKKMGEGLTKAYRDLETGTREVTKKIGDGLRNAWTTVMNQKVGTRQAEAGQTMESTRDESSR